MYCAAMEGHVAASTLALDTIWFGYWTFLSWLCQNLSSIVYVTKIIADIQTQNKRKLLQHQHRGIYNRLFVRTNAFDRRPRSWVTRRETTWKCKEHALYLIETRIDYLINHNIKYIYISVYVL